MLSRFRQDTGENLPLITWGWLELLQTLIQYIYVDRIEGQTTTLKTAIRIQVSVYVIAYRGFSFGNIDSVFNTLDEWLIYVYK